MWQGCGFSPVTVTNRYLASRLSPASRLSLAGPGSVRRRLPRRQHRPERGSERDRGGRCGRWGTWAAGLAVGSSRPALSRSRVTRSGRGPWSRAVPAGYEPELPAIMNGARPPA